MTAITLRPYLSADADALAELFRASVHELAADDYDEDQRAAWACAGEDEDAFGKRLASMLTLVAMLEGEIVGFASLRGKDALDMLYVLPEAARMGVATTLADALEKLAAARGVIAVTTDASETAAPFFARRGYTPLARNTVLVEDEWLANTSMKKDLAANANVKGARP